MFWTEEKLAQRINELKDYRYKNIQMIESFDTVEEEANEEIIQSMPEQETKK
ncbi:hypothetical protein [Sinobaca sp. H24]|uniref:hypothetical protein n=1 Tax=Sinobaca sp. H24 TaxID=2923376 RepID=UPI002079AF92|nr:hypothetical protein [Sinobaca sp. H24]